MPRILIVDDDRVSLTIILRVLRQANYEVFPLDHARDLRRAMLRHLPDLVITDLIMPDIDGSQVLEGILGDPETRHVPVMVLSSMRGSRNRITYLRSGAVDYLEKPFAPEELLLRVERLLKHHKDQEEGFRGKVEAYPTAELVQHLSQDQKYGRLDFKIDLKSGFLLLAKGRLCAARYHQLEGPDAFWAILEESAGKFHFHPMDPESLEGSGGLNLGVQDLLMEFFWVVDELERRQTLLPPLDAPLIVKSSVPSAQAVWGGLPMEKIISTLKNHSSISTIKNCLDAKIASPKRVLLGCCWLLEQGHIALA